MKLFVYWWKADRTASSTASTTVYNANLTAADAWQNISAVVDPPSDAVYASLELNSANTGVSYFNNASLEVEPFSFQVYGAATTAPGTKGVFQVKFNNESHDYGGNYDHSGSAYDFEAPAAGVYEFSSKIEGVYVGSFSYLLLMIYKNGAVLKSNYGTDRTVSSLVGFASVDTGPIELVKGDLITVQMHPEIQTSYTLSTGAHQTYFSGRKIT